MTKYNHSEFFIEATKADAIDDEERRLIDEAVAAGKVQKIPQGQSTTYPDYVWDPKARRTGMTGALVARNPQDWKRQKSFIRKKEAVNVAQNLDEVERLSKANLSKVQIAKALGISTTAVSRYRKRLVEAGRLEPMSTSPKPSGKVEQRRRQALKMFQEGLSISGVADALGETRANIRNDRYALVKRGVLAPKKLVDGVWV